MSPGDFSDRRTSLYFDGRCVHTPGKLILCLFSKNMVAPGKCLKFFFNIQEDLAGFYQILFSRFSEDSIFKTVSKHVLYLTFGCSIA